MVKNKRHQLYMDIAHRVAQESYAIRRKVGAIIVKDDNIVSIGFNGNPSGSNNDCEHYVEGILVTSNTVVHAEANSITRAAKAGRSTEGADMYLTLSPCISCSGLIKQAGIKNVFYSEEYRDTLGIKQLVMLDVTCKQLKT